MATIKVILVVIAISAFASSANGRALLQNPKGDMETTFYHHGHYFPPYGWPYGGGFGRTRGRFGPGFGGSMGSVIGSGSGGTGGELGTGGIGSENNGGSGDDGSVLGVEKGAFEVPGDGVEGGMH